MDMESLDRMRPIQSAVLYLGYDAIIHGHEGGMSIIVELPIAQVLFDYVKESRCILATTIWDNGELQRGAREYLYTAGAASWEQYLSFCRYVFEVAAPALVEKQMLFTLRHQ